MELFTWVVLLSLTWMNFFYPPFGPPTDLHVTLPVELFTWIVLLSLTWMANTMYDRTVIRLLFEQFDYCYLAFLICVFEIMSIIQVCLSIIAPSSNYYNTLFEVPNNPLQIIITPSSNYYSTIFKVSVLFTECC